ncbi:MAG: dockerin type I repeat-containing protein [Ruminococcus sp.]|nr:dockerin type I repeat-containing protein [Ruminococcus sp.]
MKRKAKNILITAGVVSVFGLNLSMAVMDTSADQNIEIKSVPSNAVSAKVTFRNTDNVFVDTNAFVTVSNGKATIKNITEHGYYSLLFSDGYAEVGTAEFYFAESGKIYSYEREYSSGNEQWNYNFTAVDKPEYKKLDNPHIIDISGKYSAKINGLSSDTKKAIVNVSTDNGYIGDKDYNISISSDESTVIDNIGVAGDYSVHFYDNDNNDTGYAEFRMDSNGKLYESDYVYNAATNKWTYVYNPVTYVNMFLYDDDIGDTEEQQLHDISVSGTGKTYSVEVTRLDGNFNVVECSPEISIKSDSVQINGLYSDYYNFNFLDDSGVCIGYSNFYLGEDGTLYSYETVNGSEKTRLNEISSVPFNTVTKEKIYSYGNLSVCVSGVPSETEAVEALYFIGDKEDEAIFFEPEVSSFCYDPLYISGLGAEGKYRLNFIANGDYIGYTEFYLSSDNKVYEYVYDYNASSQKWEENLSETDMLYYIDNMNIQDGDDYNYGNLKLTVTNVPADISSSDIIFYGMDSSFSAGDSIFPSVEIKNGKAVIDNLGEAGFYELRFMKKDKQDISGYVFFCIDENSVIYNIEYYVNPDTYEMETIVTKGSEIVLDSYNSNTVDYVSGSKTVSIYDVPVFANKVIISCTGKDGEYASYEENISVSAENVVKLEKLGMEGNYTVTFMTNKDTVGTASFYLKSDGTVCEAVYSDDGAVKFNSINKVKFIQTDNSVAYDAGDIDFNGSVNIADAVILQKYIMNISEITLPQHRNADINNDGVTDVFDMVLMKKLIVDRLR